MVLGIDIGSMAISAVLFDERGQITETFYESHKGQIGACLQKLAGIGMTQSVLPAEPQTVLPGKNQAGTQASVKPRIALTSSSRLNLNGSVSIDIQTALVKASSPPFAQV